MRSDVWTNDNAVTNANNCHVVHVAGGLHICMYYQRLQTTLQYLTALCPLYLGKLERSKLININADVVHGKVLTCTNAADINSIYIYIYTQLLVHANRNKKSILHRTYMRLRNKRTENLQFYRGKRNECVCKVALLRQCVCVCVFVCVDE